MPTLAAVGTILRGISATRCGDLALFGVLFIFVISPVLTLQGTEIQLPKFVMVVMASFGLLRLAAQGAIDRRMLAVLLALVAGFFYLTLIFSVYQFRDDVMVKTMAWAFAVLFGSYWLVAVYHERYGEQFVGRLLLHLFLVGTLHGTIMSLAFLITDFREWLYQYIWLNDEGRRFVEFNFRSPGLTSSGGAKLSVFQAVAMLCGLMQSDQVVRSALRLLLFAGACLILLASIALSGRTGLVVLALGGLFIYVRRWFGLVGGSTLLLRKAVVAVLIVATLAVGLAATDYARYQRVLMRAFEFYYAWQESGRIGTASTDVILGRMYFWPMDPWAMLLGTSNFGRGDELPYIHSDVGYVRFVFGAGIVGTLLAFSHYAAIGWHVLKDRITDRNLAAMIGFVLFILVLVNFKELLFVDIHGWSQTVYLLFCAFVMRRSRDMASRPGNA